VAINLFDGSLLPVLPCACANLRRAARAVTRIYNQELRATGLELTQYTLLMALDITGETTQGELGRVLALDSTTLTRMLSPLKKHGWIGTQPGKDRRQRLLRLSASGRRKLQESHADWARAQAKLRQSLGEAMWNEIQKLLTDVASVSSAT